MTLPVVGSDVPRRCRSWGFSRETHVWDAPEWGALSEWEGAGEGGRGGEAGCLPQAGRKVWLTTGGQGPALVEKRQEL